MCSLGAAARLEAASAAPAPRSSWCSRWRRLFLEGGTNGFKRRDTPAAERELKRVQAKVGELTMKLEIVEWFLEKKGYGEELKKLKRSGEL